MLSGIPSGPIALLVLMFVKSLRTSFLVIFILHISGRLDAYKKFCLLDERKEEVVNLVAVGYSDYLLMKPLLMKTKDLTLTKSFDNERIEEVVNLVYSCLWITRE